MLEINKVYCGDCNELIREMDENSIDLTVTSPPYGELRTFKGHTFDFEELVRGLYRATAEGGVVVWVISDSSVDGSETGDSFRQALFFMKTGFNLHDTMIYQKNSSTYPTQSRYTHCFEYMFVFSKSAPKTANIIRTKAKNRCRKCKTTYRENDGTMRTVELVKDNKGTKKRDNIWKYETGYNKTTKDKVAFEHPSIFPEKLAEDHIISWSNQGDLVLDPFAGSGTTLKMARKLGRDYIGFEASEEYCDIIKRRMRDNNHKLGEY